MKPGSNYFPFLTILFLLAAGAPGLAIDFKGKRIIIGQSVKIFEDPTGKLGYKEVERIADFYPSEAGTPNLGISKSAFWIKFTIRNQSNDQRLILELANPKIGLCELYAQGSSPSPLAVFRFTDNFRKRMHGHTNPLFELPVAPGTARTFLLKVKGNVQLTLPLIVSNEKGLIDTLISNNLLIGIHIGILFAMILYNLFLYFSIHDRNYLYYICYIIFIGLTQATLTGYTYKFLWPDFPDFDGDALIFLPALAGIFIVRFFQNTLHTRQKVPAFHYLLNFIIAFYTLAIVVQLLGYEHFSYRLIDMTGLLGVIMLIIIATKLSLQNYRPARFFLLAWSIFLIGIILYVMRNLNLLPYNIFTNYTMQAGTAIEVILLSFALADRINTLKKEKELSQRAALEASLENQRIIQEQNVYLEKKVAERTEALTHSNTELSSALLQLKNAQTSLIESEKMASLGQLTAGVAHEINNPINFVSSNIKPLKRDIDDLMEVLSRYEALESVEAVDALREALEEINRLKKEMDIEYTKTEVPVLLKGIEEGANRTVGIVRELKNFSRLDEADLKLVNLNEGIESTLVILNYQLGNHIRLVKELGNIPEIECYAGKMNQVFMNILSNSIYALDHNPNQEEPATIRIKTWVENNEYIYLSFQDNGPGIPPELKAKIFDPFFTTKDVGKGTGLGLSIVFKIIESHYGSIEVSSEPGKFTEFLIKLPIHNQI